MFDTMTIIMIVLTLSASAAAGYAVLTLSKVKRSLSELGLRVLESQDIGKIKDVANKADTIDSRLVVFEEKMGENKGQLEEHKSKLSELADKQSQIEQKMATFNVRCTELSDKLDSVEQTVNKNESGLAQTVPNIKALADEIQNLKIFQAATEKAHGLIIDAFSDMQADVPSGESPITEPQHTSSEESTPESVTSEEASQKHQENQEEPLEHKVSGSRPWFS